MVGEAESTNGVRSVLPATGLGYGCQHNGRYSRILGIVHILSENNKQNMGMTGPQY